MREKLLQILCTFSELSRRPYHGVFHPDYFDLGGGKPCVDNLRFGIVPTGVVGIGPLQRTFRSQRPVDEDDGVGLGFVGMIYWDLPVSSLHKGVILEFAGDASCKFQTCVRHSKSKHTYFATSSRWGRAAVWAARCDGRGDSLTCIIMVHRSLIRTIRIEAALLTLPVPCIRPLAQIVERRIRYRRRQRGWRARAGGRGGRGWRGARSTSGWC